MSALRPAVLDEYLTWLRAWLDAGHQPTHVYNYPFSRQEWLTATRNFRLGGERGANSVEIIVPSGIEWISGDLGHNKLYFLDGPQQMGDVVPVFSDPQFLALPGVPEFMRKDERERAARRQEAAKRKAAAARRARDSDVPSRY